MVADLMDKIVSLAKRRGFVFPSAEIYGGLSGVWDYGPLGVLLKNNIKAAWWRAMVQERDDVEGLDSAILTHPMVLKASGHVDTFADALVECKRCHVRFRADEVGEVCPECGGREFTEPRMFNTMFKTYFGPVEEEAAIVYLRPETAQGIFVNFLNVLNTTRRKLPFGIAQVGKAFRNEITTGNFIFRDREFEQMELEYFVKPGTDEEYHRYWAEERLNWYVRYGIKAQNLRLRALPPEELAHYSKATVEVEYRFPWGWTEIEGIANRTDYDLRRHSEFSGKDLTYYDEETGQHITPYVIEPSAGVDRVMLAFMLDAYDEEPDKEGTRVVLRFHPAIAPIKVAVLPLSKREPLIRVAKEIHRELRRHWVVDYDETQSIGRRYRRQDEVGTPYCVTVDFQTLEDNAVTIRDRDTMAQVRVPIPELRTALAERLNAE